MKNQEGSMWKKRQVDQLDMLEGDIQDDEYLFGDFHLSKREKKELDYKKTVVHLAKDYKKAGELEKIDRYEVSMTLTKLLLVYERGVPS